MNRLPNLKKLDQGGLTRCVHAKETCPHPAICKRRASADERGYDLYDPVGDDGSCMFFVEHETIRDERKIFRGGGRRHNAHAPPPGSHRHRVLPVEPDLMVKRHLRSGKDINDG